MDGIAGVTTIDVRAAAVTLKVVPPEIVPEVAVIVATPIPMLVASPWLPAELLIVATLDALELQDTELVTSSVPPSV